MVKKTLAYFLTFLFLPMLCACNGTTINTQTGNLGHRADKLQEYVGNTNVSKDIESKSNIIYLGREYENNNFGPGKIKFVFEK